MTITATYHAPDKDSEVVTTRGVRFFDGQPVELNRDEHSALIGKLRGNPHFEVAGADEAETPTPVLEARHRGRGVYAIVRSDETLVEGLNKADAEAFNAMTDDDKATYVQAALEDAAPPAPAA
jgi:hypothetical protein